MAHPDTRPFIIIGIVGIVLIVIGVLFLVATTKDSNSFRVMRVLVWLQPEKYSDEGGYQTLQALYAIGSGAFSDGDLETVSRNWEVFLRLRTI